MAEYSHELKIPKERIAVLIGKSGEEKKKLEEVTKTKLNVDSTEGDVTISGDDPITLFSAREMIKAIGRGFNPEIAILLLKQDYAFELINIQDYAKTKNDAIRLKGRVIGSEGKSRRVIESLCEVYISVYGKTIGIVGELGMVSIARRAIESLLSGSPHANVYRWLERQRREVRRTELEGPIELKEEVRDGADDIGEEDPGDTDKSS
ncbi:RNA-processing protein [Candidatus Woesearchaeota archaeon]|nr:RNA-processing protein [Candidatus Woesearchaeota archaeon]